jgi:hypothetical protein
MSGMPNARGIAQYMKMWQFFPDRQLLSVIDVESNKHQGIRQTHPRDVEPDPVLATAA